MDTQLQPTTQSRRDRNALRFLNPDQIDMIDEALCHTGDYGEVRLVVEKGKLRFIVINTSIDVRNWNSQKLDLLLAEHK
jgi:hypothetical protein